MIKLILFLILYSQLSHAWTLNNNFGASFKDNRVKVFFDDISTCNNIKLSSDDVQSMIEPAIEDFWNRVPTSNLILEDAGFSRGIANINEGRLCSPTDDACIAAGDTIPAVNEIVIACNGEIANFGSGNVLAVTVPNKFSGKNILGAVILINDHFTSIFGNLSRADQIAVIAHEIGHAIGLGHSEEKSALMYYRTVDLRKRLGQDDIDGVSFLYPMKGDLYGLSEDGVLAACGSVTSGKTPPSNPPFVQMGITLGILIIAFELVRLLNRSKTRSTL
jgi:hypothetical protein